MDEGLDFQHALPASAGASPHADKLDHMDRRTERLAGTSRLLRGPDDGTFDRQFWRSIPPRERLTLMWDMVLEWTAWKGRPDGKQGLQRSVCRVERRRR